MKVLAVAAGLIAVAVTVVFFWPSDPEPIPVVETGPFPAKPAPGTVFWGSSVSNNGDPSVFEGPTGETLAIRRSFFQWDQRTDWMMETVADDLAAGRLPWVSVKTPAWVSMSAGEHDDEIDEMLRALDAAGGAVWLTIHHEPEGGGEDGNTPDDPGGPAAHLAMNRRVRERMDALGTVNVALAPILMSYTFNPDSGRNPDEWWDPSIYDFLGIDHYRWEGTDLLNDQWWGVRRWAAENATDVAVAEWGLEGSDERAAEGIRAWFDSAAASDSDGRGARVVALTAFDSEAHERHLEGDALAMFEEIMSDPRVAHLS